MAQDILAVDTSHLLYRVFYAVVGNQSSLSPRQQRIATNTALQELKTFQKKFKPDVLIAAFDAKHSWRSEYAQRNGLRTYRSNRYKFNTLKEKRLKQAFDQFREHFKQILRKTQGIYVAEGDMLEADDIISGIVEYKNNDDTVHVVTLDQDMALLMLSASVIVYNMKTLKRFATIQLRTKRLERILRGRHSYSVLSVFNRLSSKTFNRFMAGAITLNEMLEQVPANPDSTMSAKNRFKHNEVLLDVTKSPQKIKKRVREALRNTFRINK